MAKKKSYRASRGGKERGGHSGADYTFGGEYAPRRLATNRRPGVI